MNQPQLPDFETPSLAEQAGNDREKQREALRSGSSLTLHRQAEIHKHRAQITQLHQDQDHLNREMADLVLVMLQDGFADQELQNIVGFGSFDFLYNLGRSRSLARQHKEDSAA